MEKKNQGHQGPPDPNKVLLDERQIEIAWSVFFNIYNGMLKGGFSEAQASKIIAEYLFLLFERAERDKNGR